MTSYYGQRTGVVKVNQLPLLLSHGDAAEVLGISKSTIGKLCRLGKLRRASLIGGDDGRGKYILTESLAELVGHKEPRIMC